MISKELVEINYKKLLDEQKRLMTMLNRDDVADQGIPGGFKPKFSDVGSEEGENASEVEQFGNNLSVTEELDHKLIKVNDALKRIEDGTYGKCKMGDEIEELRLAAEPSADTCLKHAK